jgi:NAD(P)-dependent dehydrogenase (short-subunit alcohol dehydrogenase family)
MLNKKTDEEAAGFQSFPGCTALVTGSSGLCGARIVELLLERGASKVLAFDISVPSPVLLERFAKIQKATGGTIQVFAGRDGGDLTNTACVEKAFASADKIDVVFHVAGLGGPFF